MFYATVDKGHFIDAWKQARSEQVKTMFSYTALEKLFEHYDELGDDGDVKFNRSEISMIWTEYDSLQQLEEDYANFNMETLKKQTTVIEVYDTNYEKENGESRFLIHEF
tara:strand:+ start:27 stop:353 length:327 start_codon:yes stop_codon:yes gene_type:complete